MSDLEMKIRAIARQELAKVLDGDAPEETTSNPYPVELDDVIDETEARKLLGIQSDASWERLHKRRVIQWYVAPGTNRRLYSRAWLLEWIRRGTRGADWPTCTEKTSEKTGGYEPDE